MIRYRFKELLADREFKAKKVITIAEVALETGIHRATLSKIANTHGYSTGTDNLDRLCNYFGCRIEQLIEHVPDKVDSAQQPHEKNSVPGQEVKKGE